MARPAFRDDKEYYESLPGKRINTGVLLFYKNQALLVQPTYASGWILPGGTVEAEESPMEGLIRDVKENLGISITPTHVLAIDYTPNKDVKGEYLSFLFGAIDLSEHQAQSIQSSLKNVRDFKFVDMDIAYSMLVPAISRRVKSALKAVTENYVMVYLEDGRIPPRDLPL
ncbi:NUDIX domain-containing protein [Bdellovibrio sp. HCB209]|uniref:NUDIX domain-containing protein n=1 Tax=Bdellovibrio sp. HCB209 TaxID=3394354 RepID=UPI0039B5E5D6